MAEANKNVVRENGPHKTLTPLRPGTRVWVQDPATRKWNRSGAVAETLGYRQYMVKLDGSGRLSRRNRRHLKVISDRPATTVAPNTEHSDPVTPASQPVSRPVRNRRYPDRLVVGACSTGDNIIR